MNIVNNQVDINGLAYRNINSQVSWLTEELMKRQRRNIDNSGTVIDNKIYRTLPEQVSWLTEQISGDIQTLNITENGAYYAPVGVSGYSPVIVNVPTNEPTGTITLISNGKYDVKDKATAVVNVPIPDGYVKPSGTQTITANGNYDITTKANVQVNVLPALQEKRTTKNGTVVADAGYDGLSKVIVDVDAALPTQSKSASITTNGNYLFEADPGYTLSDITISVNVEQPAAEETANTDWFTMLIMGKTPVEIYNDKAFGTLQAYAFYEKSAITKIELPNIEYLKERCFYGCENLTTLHLPKLAGYTYQYMAAGCTKLVDVDIHDTSYVSSYSFQNCTSLKKIDLHKVETIGTNAFVGATKFETLIIRTSIVPTLGGTNAFTNTKIRSGGTGYIYVPRAMIDQYKAAANWSTFASQFRAIEDYPDVAG